MIKTTIKLGSGNVGIATLKDAEDGVHGVIFHENGGGVVGESTGVGDCYLEDFDPHIYLQITSSSKESIQVLINELEKAKRFFDA